MLAARDCARRRRARLATAAWATLCVLGASLLLGAAPPADAAAEAATVNAPETGGLQFAVAPADAALTPGDDLRITVEAANLGESTTEAQTVEIVLTNAPMNTRYSISAWLENRWRTSATVIATIDFPALASLDTIERTVTISAADVPITEGSVFGPYGLQARPTDPQLTPASTLLVANTDTSALPVDLAVAAPVTAPVPATGLLTGAELDELLAPRGELAQAVTALSNYPISVGIDPMVSASIAALGEQVEATVSPSPSAADAEHPRYTWQSDVNALTERYNLPYANSNLLAQLSVTDSPLEPTDIPTIDDDLLPGSTGTLADGATPIIDATDLELTPELLARASKYGTVMASGAQVNEFLDRATPDSAVSIGGIGAYAIDEELDSLLDTAVQGTSTTSRNQSRAAALGLLAAITREAPSLQRELAAVLLPGTAAATSDLLRSLDDAAWVTLSPVAIASNDARSVELADEPAIDTLTNAHDTDAAVTDALTLNAAAARYARVADEPALVAAPFRLATLATLGTIGAKSNVAAPATDALAERYRELSNSISVLPGSDIQIVGQSASLPVTIVNSLPVPATVDVIARPSNASLLIRRPLTAIALPANSQTRVLLPVEVVGSGAVEISISLHIAGGPQVGKVEMLHADARPTVETFLSIFFGAGAALLFGWGLYRSIRKRRKGLAHGDLDNAIEHERELHSASAPHPESKEDA